MIHDASHYVFERRHPSARPHDGGHAALEREMVEYVARKGWAVPKAPKLKARPSYAERLTHTRALMARWETKAKRADTAIPSWARSYPPSTSRPNGATGFTARRHARSR
jgi:hypothetical protein